MEYKEALPAFLFGLGAGVLFYIIGGVAAPYFAGINAPVSGALGFLIGTGLGLTKK
uniref:Uncharacterized protein n=1 Tax=viral metagenome TaxID=1070528 RepID=A0A6H1ZP65_9ZZZZ